MTEPRECGVAKMIVGPLAVPDDIRPGGLRELEGSILRHGDLIPDIGFDRVILVTPGGQVQPLPPLQRSEDDDARHDLLLQPRVPVSGGFNDGTLLLKLPTGPPAGTGKQGGEPRIQCQPPPKVHWHIKVVRNGLVGSDAFIQPALCLGGDVNGKQCDQDHNEKAARQAESTIGAEKTEKLVHAVGI